MVRIALIGSGLAGAVLARRLAEFAEVTVYERGDRRWRPAATPDWEGRPIGMAASFAHGLGGTTNLWHGGLMRIAPAEFGRHWPTALRLDLENHIPDAVRDIYGDAALALFNARPVVSEDDGPWEDWLLKPAAPFRARSAYGDPRLTLQLAARVTHLEPGPAGVEVVYRQGGATHCSRHDMAIVAAGAFGSPEILLRSGLGGPAVGRHLHDHPMGFVAKLRPDPAALARIHAARAAMPARSEVAYKVRDAEAGLTTAFYLRPAAPGPLRSDPYADAAQVFAPGRRLHVARALARTRDPDFRRIALSRTFGEPPGASIFYVLALSEQEPLDQGQITLAGADGVRVAWRISDRALAALSRNLATFARSLGGEPILPGGGLAHRLWSAAHHSGACRISESTAHGVVGEDLAVHGAERVYVCDSSMLPSSGATNTGLTIAALAVRLAKQIRAITAPPQHARRHRDLVPQAQGAAS